MTPDDVAALLYRAWIAARFGALGFRSPGAAVAAYAWSDLDNSTRRDWLAVAEEAIRLAPALAPACAHVQETREPIYDPNGEGNTIIGHRARCRRCGRVRAD